MIRLSGRKLRIGVLMDSYILPAWSCDMLARVKASTCCELSLVVLNDSPPAPRRTFLQRLRKCRPWDGLLYRSLCRLEDFRSPFRPNAFDSRDATGVIAGAPVLKVRPLRRKFIDTLSQDDVQAIKEYELDVMVRLGFRILHGDVLNSARCGVWSYHHGDNHVNRGGPPGFWEMSLDMPVTGSVLQILNEDLDGGLVLARSWSATDPLSVNHNRNNYYWKTSLMLLRKLKELHELGTDLFLQRAQAQNRHPDFYCKPIYRKPTNVECAKTFCKLATRYVHRNLQSHLYRDQWILLYAMQEQMPSTLLNYQRLVPPTDRFWADPHIVLKDSLYYVFFEEFMYETGKAHISLLTINQRGSYKYHGPVLERPYHLSYPHVFNWQGSYWMVPETRQSGNIELYRCLSFPNVWKHHVNLMEDVQAVDCTFLPHGNQWWMFANIAEIRGVSTWDELFLFKASSPVSQNWRPHKANPVISDVRRARPAGNFFHYNGMLYRPSQDCSRGYGSALRLNQVMTLNDSRYLEQEICTIHGGFDSAIQGLHTFCHEKHLTMLDANCRYQRFNHNENQGLILEPHKARNVESEQPQLLETVVRP